MVRTVVAGGGMAEAEGLHDGREVEGNSWRWLVFLALAQRVATLFAKLVQRLAVATVVASVVGKEFTLGSLLLNLGAGRSTDTAVLVGR
jgi:hypothetical protein